MTKKMVTSYMANAKELNFSIAKMHKDLVGQACKVHSIPCKLSVTLVKEDALKQAWELLHDPSSTMLYIQYALVFMVDLRYETGYWVLYPFMLVKRDESEPKLIANPQLGMRVNSSEIANEINNAHEPFKEWQKIAEKEGFLPELILRQYLDTALRYFFCFVSGH